jgi:uncharacterized protein YbjT (DUF2867 family)
MRILVTGAAGFRPPFFVGDNGAAIHLIRTQLFFGTEVKA